ncbi:MAG TPA: type II/IV secretion system ATPase subunit [Candidatus Thermoplasmatota archaeon]|nr:type II/IV secretion system ATPase subunit [Candidatus Thermoplasmatota archaeon]
MSAASARTPDAPPAQDPYARRPPHLDAYLEAYRQETGRTPVLLDALRATDDFASVDHVYPIGEDLFVHLRPVARGLQYTVVQPELTPAETEAYRLLRDAVFRAAQYLPPPKDAHALERELSQLFEDAVRKEHALPRLRKDRRKALRDRLLRDVARAGILQPFLLDPYLEDIQAVGTDPIHVIHKYYDMMPSNVRFDTLADADQYLRNLSERIGRPVSDARPIVDATMLDGSRINIVYSEDVSRKGPSFSIRRVHADPISVTQLIAWGTMSAEMAAYLWLCLENGMSVFINGEAACGKSATLNAILAFVDPRAKLFSAEDTPEVRPPHQVWQRLLTRESGPEESRVRMFDLLRAALRSRPNYIVVGEIRGAEGAVAFQAMQTGHPTVATFHAADKVKMIQRLSSPPISIPLTFMDNLNVAVFQQALYRNGRLIRRVTAVDELQGYSEVDGGIVTLPVFSYDGKRDAYLFKGNNNSYVLEKKIAEQHGFEDPQEIYRVLQRRAKVLQALVDHKVFRFDDVNRILFAYRDQQENALPFPLELGELAAAGSH